MINNYQEANDNLIKQGDPGNSWFSTSNIVGEWAELIVCKSLKLIQKTAANKGFNAIDNKNRKYQIKSRWYRYLLKSQFHRSGTYEFGYVKKENGHFLFDYLVLVLFENVLTKNYRVYKIDANNIDESVKEKVIIKKKDMYIVRWSINKFDNRLIKDITCLINI